MLYDRNSHLYEPIFQDPSVIPVLNRYGITLGVGDATIGSACERMGISEVFFLDIINTYLNELYNTPSTGAENFQKLILEYLEKTDIYYRDVQLPNVENHFKLLIGKSGATNGNLHLLKDFFQEVKEEFNKMIINDLEYWIPFLLQLCEIDSFDVRVKKFTEFMKTNRLGLPFDNSQLNEKLEDLLAFFTIHLHGNYDKNLCVAVVSALFTLKKDVSQNGRIRKKLFLPAVINLVGEDVLSLEEGGIEVV